MEGASVEYHTGCEKRYNRKWKKTTDDNQIELYHQGVIMIPGIGKLNLNHVWCKPDILVMYVRGFEPITAEHRRIRVPYSSSRRKERDCD